jgi:crotonobetainyl-CoA:carnitine CoA-transferase CaiB-like acyl-CoA transferase
MLGQHTHEVLRELGMDQTAIDALTKSGTISST